VSIEKVLVANRGEIACRIFRTTRRMGIVGVAVYSDADASARHVAVADESLHIGPSPSSESYLNVPAILAAATRCGADAIHPGYGFLSENADFAAACLAAGFIFIGPTEDTIRKMAEKDLAKALMEAAGVRVIPGHAGENQAPGALRAAGDQLGYPLLIKAIAGGGGRGMRAVHRADDFAAALEAAKREARSAFGDDRMLLERLLSPTRHIEVQLFGDAHGNLVHLFERDCSIQRRHQKIVEEAPAPGLSEELRSRLGAAAVTAGRAIGYRGAGTVEFLLDTASDPARSAGSSESPSFYFMEMNTRLQVEHPVTEMVTGIDLVEWQIRVADGQPLPLRQDEIALRGHSIEVRVCAEDPAVDFLPTAGPIHYLAEPELGNDLRVETGVRQGDEVSVYYDSMLAKLVVWGEDRSVALGRLREALSQYQLAGVATNLSLLARIAHHPGFENGCVDNTFIEANAASLLGAGVTADSTVLVLASLDSVLSRARRSDARAVRNKDRHSPWNATDTWRLNSKIHDVLHFVAGGEERTTEVRWEGSRGVGDGYSMRVSGEEILTAGRTLCWREFDSGRGVLHRFEATLAERTSVVVSVLYGAQLTLFFEGETFRLSAKDLASGNERVVTGEGVVVTPMPGKIIEVLVSEGDAVENGQPMIVLEAMKMEHSVRAGGDAIVESLNVAVGDQVDDGATLLVLAVREDG
jgi:3-methylcrotonyl-CoA carboxylase alpha subunit